MELFKNTETTLPKVLEIKARRILSGGPTWYFLVLPVVMAKTRQSEVTNCFLRQISRELAIRGHL